MIKSVRITQISPPHPNRQYPTSHSLCHTTWPAGTPLSQKEPPFLQQWCEVLQNNLQILLMPPLGYCKSYPFLAGSRTPKSSVWFRRCSPEAKLVSKQCRMFLLSQSMLENVRWIMLDWCLNSWTLYPAMPNALYFMYLCSTSSHFCSVKVRKRKPLPCPITCKITHVYGLWFILQCWTIRDICRNTFFPVIGFCFEFLFHLECFPFPELWICLIWRVGFICFGICNLIM